MMKTKATHAQRGLPHTSLHLFSLKHRSRTSAHTTLTHLQALRIVIMYLCHGLYYDKRFLKIVLRGSNIKGLLSEMIFRLPFAFSNFILTIPFNFN